MIIIIIIIIIVIIIITVIIIVNNNNKQQQTTIITKTTIIISIWGWFAKLYSYSWSSDLKAHPLSLPYPEFQTMETPLSLWNGTPGMGLPEKPLILGRSRTQYVVMITKLLSLYCGEHLVETYCKASDISDTNWPRSLSSLYLIENLVECMMSSVG